MSSRVAVETGDPIGRLFAERWAKEGNPRAAVRPATFFRGSEEQLRGGRPTRPIRPSYTEMFGAQAHHNTLTLLTRLASGKRGHGDGSRGRSITTLTKSLSPPSTLRWKPETCSGWSWWSGLDSPHPGWCREEGWIMRSAAFFQDSRQVEPVL